jgi:hypothetical protein
MEAKIKHLEFIQAVINRMAGDCFLLKGWTVTLVVALFSLSAKDTNHNYFLIAYFSVILFWVLNGYFLSQERLFRALYDHVRKINESKIDFSMDTKKFQTDENSWLRSIFSQPLLIFYLTLVGVMLIIMYLIK